MRLFPFHPPCNVSDKDRLFSKIRGAVPNPPQRERVRQVWIPPETWRLANEKIAARRYLIQRSVCSLGRKINASIQGGRQRSLAEAGASIESFLVSYPPLVKEVWIWVQGWYKDAGDPPPIQDNH